jgi:hypothetical protein
MSTLRRSHVRAEPNSAILLLIAAFLVNFALWALVIVVLIRLFVR